MHRDTKLGLALGMLVVGFATAFCFPRQPQPAQDGLTVSTGAMDEASVELISVRAYRETHPGEPALQAILNEESRKAEPAVVPAAQVFPGRTEFRRVPELSGLPEPAVPARAAKEGGAPAQEPQAAENRVAASSIDPARSSLEPAAPRTYTVQSGDTLSGIALRFLGSSARFREIFEANRAQLESPDDLKLGMVLTIPPPDGDRPREEAPSPSPPEGPEDGGGATLAERPVRPFQRVENAPFVTVPGDRLSQSSEGDSPSPR